MLPDIAPSISASLGWAFFATSADADMIWPDWQYPHCTTSRSSQACCTFLPAGVSPIASMVVIFFPATAATGVTQERIGCPSRCTVQAPHNAIPQPNFVPVSRHVYRHVASVDVQGCHESLSVRERLHLCEAAIHKQLRSRDVTAVVGGEKRHRLRDLIRCAEPAEWNRGGNHLRALLARFRGSEQLTQPGGVDRAWAHGVHADAAIPQVHRPRARERADGGLRGTVHAVRWKSLAPDDGRIQNDRGAIRQERQRLLHREQDAFDVDVEDRVEELFSDLAQRRILRHTGVGKHDIELALLTFDLREQAIEIGRVRHVSLHAGDISAERFHRRGQLGLAPPRDVDVGAFVHELLRGREADAATATGDERDFPVELAHQARNLTSSVFTWSAWVHSTPCGPSLSSTNLTSLIIFACLRDVASGGRIRSASPCKMSVGTSLREMSLRKSSIHASTHASVPVADAPAATFQLSSTTRSLTSFPPSTS